MSNIFCKLIKVSLVYKINTILANLIYIALSQLKATDYKKDLKSLACNMSFVFSTLGFTCVSFCTGALAWWGPKYIEDAIYSMELAPEDRPIAVDR